MNELSDQCRVADRFGFFGHGWVAFCPPGLAGHSNRPFLVWWVSASQLTITETEKEKDKLISTFKNVLSSPEFNINHQEEDDSCVQISVFVIFHWTRLTYSAYLYVLGSYGSVVILRQQQVSYVLLYFLCVWQRHHDLNLENAALSADGKKI